MQWDNVSGEYRNLKDKSDEWLFEALRSEVRLCQEIDAIPMAERWPGIFNVVCANIAALGIELESRGYKIPPLRVGRDSWM